MQYNPFTPGDLFEAIYNPKVNIESTFELNPRFSGEAECKACATRLKTPSQAELQAHANELQKRSDGSPGTCGEFWVASKASA